MIIFGLTIGVLVGVLIGVTCGPWFLDSLGRIQGGVWRHGGGFTCPGCNHRRRIARPGPTRHALCLHCSPAPQSGGNR